MNDKIMLNEVELEKVTGGENVVTDVPFSVEMISGPYKGKKGTAIKLLCTEPVKMYIVELDKGLKDPAGLDPLINEDDFIRL